MAIGPPIPKCIYIIGAQCTGKTTLIAELATLLSAAEPKPLLIKEIARGILQRHKYTAEDITSSPIRALELQHLIFSAQVLTEDELAGQWYISDRSALDPVVYAKLYASNEGAGKMLESERWQVSRSRMRAGLVIVCQAGTPWLVNDGVRLVPGSSEEWMAVHDTFCYLLQEQDIPFTVIENDMTDLKARVQRVLAAYEDQGDANDVGL